MFTLSRLLLPALSIPLLTAVPLPTGTPAAAAPASSVVLGPPWISIEYPVNPYDASTRDAFLVVHAFHHGTPTSFPVSGTAEGLVNGKRSTIPLQFRPTSRQGVYSLNKQWPVEGAWSLVIGVAQGPEDRVSAIVQIDREGHVARVTVPTRTDGRHTLPARVDMQDVEAGLRARAR